LHGTKDSPKRPTPALPKLALTRTGKKYGPYLNHKLHHKPLALIHSSNFAELMGIILGDGSLTPVSRTERLSIALNSRDRDQIRFVKKLIENVIGQEPKTYITRKEHCVHIFIYRNLISKSIGLPLGNKIRNNVGIPNWIKENSKYLRYCIRGLFETDGCLVAQPSNYTMTLDFTNRCTRLLDDMNEGLTKLGYHPQKHSDYVRLSKKLEVKDFVRKINYRNFDARLN